MGNQRRARIIMDTSGAKLWLPGISDPDTLDAASRLCGTTAMRETRSLTQARHDHPDYYGRHLVMTPEMIRQLPGRHALIVRGGMSPAIARLPMAWQNHAYKHARRRHESIAYLEPIPDTGQLPFTAGNGHRDLPDTWPGPGPGDGQGPYPWQ